jgi:hypothetical protein
MYDVGDPGPALQLRVTVPPEFVVVAKPVGAPGRTQPTTTTTTTISFDAGPAVELESTARTRT